MMRFLHDFDSVLELHPGDHLGKRLKFTTNLLRSFPSGVAQESQINIRDIAPRRQAVQTSRPD